MEKLEFLEGEFEKALLQINRTKAAEIFEKCYLMENGFASLEKLAINTLENIGDGWENGSISLSQVYMSGIICEELIEKYLPYLVAPRKETPKLAIAVLQDHHALGKRLVNSVLVTGGYEVIDFGHGLSVDELVEKTLAEAVEILLISTLMLPSALKVKEVKAKLRASGAKTKIIVGGAPFRLDSELWLRVDADADGKNASNIIKIINMLLQGEGE